MDEFQIPVNIATELDAISQMCHFLIVNTTQKSVDALSPSRSGSFSISRPVNIGS